MDENSSRLRDVVSDRTFVQTLCEAESIEAVQQLLG